MNHPVQCSTCVNGNEMFRVDDRQDDKNRVTFYIQRAVHLLGCPLYQYQRWKYE